MTAIIFKELFCGSRQQIGITVCSDFLKDAHKVDKNTFVTLKSTGRIHK
jgi:hypothetical protein